MPNIPVGQNLQPGELIIRVTLDFEARIIYQSARMQAEDWLSSACPSRARIDAPDHPLAHGFYLLHIEPNGPGFRLVEITRLSGAPKNDR